MFHAVYISDTNNNLVYEYLLNLSSPKFKSLSHVLIQAQSLPDSLPLIEINSEFFLIYEKTKNLIIYVLCSNENHPNPLMPVIFIQRLIEVMSDYFGTPLALTKIDANNDTLTLLINEMLDDGVPNTTDFNKLRDLVPTKSLLSKILSSPQEMAAAATNKANSVLNSSSNDLHPNRNLNSIPWRRSNVKYTNNEMYVDIVETVNIILKPVKVQNKTQLYSSNNHFDSAFYSSVKSSSRMVPISGNIQGQINFVSHLTGIPLLQLILSINGLNLQLPSFHRCIELDRWVANPGTLSFIPPDGKSVLMNYDIDLDSVVNKKDQLSMMGLVNVDFQSGLGTNKNEFEIKVLINNIKSVSKIENLKIEIVCDGEDEEDRGSSTKSEVINVKSNRITHGDFTYQGKGIGEWNLRTINTGIQPLLQGTIITSNLEESYSFEEGSPSPNLIDVDSNSLSKGSNGTSPPPNKPIKPIHLALSFSYKGSVPSGLKVESLKVVSAKGLGDSVKPYKGVKYITKSGDFIVRS